LVWNASGDNHLMVGKVMANSTSLWWPSNLPYVSETVEDRYLLQIVLGCANQTVICINVIEELV
jgi:hypothetical protein